ncbi:unnamed protein product [Rhodiola kirilowii]
MQMFRPSNECYEQSNNYQSSMKPFAKPAGYGGNSLAQCQTQTQCLRPNSMESQTTRLVVAMECNMLLGPKAMAMPFPRNLLGSIPSRGHTVRSSMEDTALLSQVHLDQCSMEDTALLTCIHGAYGSAHHGSFGSGCEAQSGGYNYTMKKKERRSWRKRSGNDSDSSGSDESDNEKC